MRMGAPGGPPGYGGAGRSYPGPGPQSSYNGPSYNGPGPGGYPPPPGPGYPGYPSPSSAANSLPASSNPSSEQPGEPNSERAKPVVPPSVETTGPDGQPMHDETSQQSTLSQSSDNSGGRQTPKGGYPQVIISAVTARLH